MTGFFKSRPGASAPNIMQSMTRLNLSPRLELCARFASGARMLCDVGTDHGYLPISLLLDGKIEYAVAADIRRSPLESARRHALEAGCGDKMRFELCDGLDFAGAVECDTVVCAGMGGETIMGILERAPWTLGGARLVLQPQSKLDELCLWLHSRGYGIRDAAVAAEGRRLYIAMLCEAGSSDSLYAEDALFARGDPLLPDWVSARSQRIERALEGMLRSSSGQSEVEDAKATLERLRRYTKEEQHDHR